MIQFICFTIVFIVSQKSAMIQGVCSKCNIVDYHINNVV